jgi:hypothetical protein
MAPCQHGADLLPHDAGGTGSGRRALPPPPGPLPEPEPRPRGPGEGDDARAPLRPRVPVRDAAIPRPPGDLLRRDRPFVLERPGGRQGARVSEVRVRPETGVGDLRRGRSRHPRPGPARRLRRPAPFLPSRAPLRPGGTAATALAQQSRVRPPLPGGSRGPDPLAPLSGEKPHGDPHRRAGRRGPGKREHAGEPRPVRRGKSSAEGSPAPGDGGVQPAEPRRPARVHPHDSDRLLPLLPGDVLRDPPRGRAPRERLPAVPPAVPRTL